MTNVEIETGSGSLSLPLNYEDGRWVTSIKINGVNYHFEQINAEELTYLYVVDNDPDYQPQADNDGMCYMISPFSR